MVVIGEYDSNTMEVQINDIPQKSMAMTADMYMYTSGLTFFSMLAKIN